MAATDARRAALALMSRVDRGEALEDAAGLAPDVRARALRLARATLRGPSEAWLAPRLRKVPPREVMWALRLGATELGEGEAPHGVVSAIVGILGEGKRTAGHKGLANAVLRALAAEGPAAWAALPPPRLPPWLRDRLVAAWGEEKTAAMEAAHRAGATLDLTAKGGPEDLAARVGGALLPSGTVRLPEGRAVTGLPGYAEGAFWVQDEAAALPVRRLAPERGERVLDLCAAPGGKTMQMAALGADVTALDSSAPRLDRLRANLSRTGLPARVLQADALDFAEGGFDAVLLDAPCTATGTIRRHPELPLIRDGSALPGLVDLQRRLLDRALALVRPGGRVVFCTCSILSEEGHGLDGERTWPDEGRDGFFVATLRA